MVYWTTYDTYECPFCLVERNKEIKFLSRDLVILTTVRIVFVHVVRIRARNNF